MQEKIDSFMSQREDGKKRPQSHIIIIIINKIMNGWLIMANMSLPMQTEKHNGKYLPLCHVKSE